MSVTSLTGTTWIINETPTYSPFRYATTTHIHATIITHDTSDAEMQLRYIELRSSNHDIISYWTINASKTAYANGAWSSENYRTITFASEPTSGGHAYDATTAETIEWLEANAVRVMPDVEVSLGNTSIASLSNTGYVTLKTAGTYLANDITVDYTKPESPEPELQSKTVTPTESVQTVTADSGYDGLSEVTVEAIDSNYVGTGITRRTYNDLTVSGATVTTPAGLYYFSASKSVASGSATTPSTYISADPVITVSASGLVEVTVDTTESVTPTVVAGYVSSGTAGNVRAYGYDTYQLTVYSGALRGA
jgi:hypothetical protein